VKLSKGELKVMDALWRLGSASVREIQQALPAGDAPAYTTVQTVVYRLEEKGAVRRVKKVGNAHVFEPLVERGAAEQSLVDQLMAAFGGSARPLVAHLIETGRLTSDDLREAERLLAKATPATAARARRRASPRERE
jgi:BlaI family penicillinase repressor